MEALARLATWRPYWLTAWMTAWVPALSPLRTLASPNARRVQREGQIVLGSPSCLDRVTYVQRKHTAAFACEHAFCAVAWLRCV